MASHASTGTTPHVGQRRFLHQLWVMIRRNLLLKRRSPKMTIIELVFPILFLAQLVVMGILQSTIKTTTSEYTRGIYEPDVQGFQEKPFSYTWPQSLSDPVYPVGVAPDSEMTRRIMMEATEYWSLASSNATRLVTRFFPSDVVMEAYYNTADVDEMNKTRRAVGIVFANADVARLSYTLRFKDDLDPPSTAKPYFREPKTCKLYIVFEDDDLNHMRVPKCMSNKYVDIGFTSLQSVLATAYAKVRFNISDGPLHLSTRMLPMAALNETRSSSTDILAMMPANILSQAVSIFIFFLITITVTEKQNKYIASMEIMGLRPAVYWLSWVVIYLTLIILVSVIGLGLAVGMSIWPKSNFLLLFIDCCLYACSLMAISLCAAAVFSRGQVAGAVTFSVLMGLGQLSLLEQLLPSVPTAGLWGMAVCSPTAFAMSLSRVGLVESKGQGLNFGNAMEDPSGFSFGHAIIMISVDVVVYLLIALYLMKVFPSDGSQKERPWFCFLPSFWFPSRSQRGPVELELGNMDFSATDFEPVPAEVRSRTAISTKSLRKVFPGSKKDAVAVDGFTYEMYEDEILAILGHNGAGKTTLINMLTGMLAPTSGDALVYGNSITNAAELEKARTMIGICPQHDVLFDTFTVREHIEFYARLKGFTDSQATGEFERIIDEIGMRDQAAVQAQRLSGGQKRRLSIAIAVVGNPKILILDEPTSGVDPYFRRFLWDMIRGFRKGRCIIITTQSMQEADVFADRKLIMAHGKLRCAGTSLFLKNRFGLGYHLTMSVEREFSEATVEDFVTSRIAGSAKTRAHAGEISFVLPKSGVTGFPALFNDLDRDLQQLKILTYGVSLTTMEEIFLKLADEHADNPSESEKTYQTGSDSAAVTLKKRDYSGLSLTTFARPPKGGVPSWRKFLALCKIRFLLLLRSKMLLAYQIVMPLLLVVTSGILSVVVKNSLGGAPKKALSIDGLGSAFRDTGANMFYTNQTGGDLNTLISALERKGQIFVQEQYGNLLETYPHYAGYLFKNATDFGTIDTATIYYNGTAVHAIPFATNLLLNAIFRLRTGSDEIFHVSSHPYAKNGPGFIASIVPDMTGFGTLMLVGFAVALIPGAFGVDICRDRQVKVRSQIRMTGCSPWLYWGSAFAVHFLQFSLSFGMIVAALYAFSLTAVTNAIWCLVVLFSLYAPAVILFSYCLSFLFAKYETAAMGIPFPLLLLGMITYFVVLMVDMTGKSETAEVLNSIFAFIFPFYGFFGAMVYVQKLGMASSILSAVGMGRSYFDWNSNIPIIMVGHAVQIPLLILLLIFVESRHFNQSFLQSFGIRQTSGKKLANVVVAGSTEVLQDDLTKEDDDVQRERTRVGEINVHADTTYAIVLRCLRKVFDIRPLFAKRKPHGAVDPSHIKEAVKNISLVFPKGEVFGLLGPNGAGKTTTLSMITGEITPTSGDIHVNGYNMHTETQSAIETMGSCPQTNTLWDDITMEEHLNLFATLNNLPASRKQDSIKTFTEGLCITEHMKKKAAALSGGTKRKLTFVISMIGNPPLVLLDEPSTGMDPQSKRNLWDMIMQSFGGERGAILTTHSMEEADALCDRIGIIVKGELQCIGSSQHLKDKFGSGYVLEVKLSLLDGVSDSERIAAIERVKTEVAVILPGAVCAEEFYNRVVFTVPKEKVSSLGTVFADLDRVKEQLNLEEYGFSQTTIEQVFLHFAKLQEIPTVPSAPPVSDPGITV